MAAATLLPAPAPASSVERGAHGGLEPLGLARDARRLRLLQARAASAAAAQSRVGGADHVAQAVGRVGRDHLEALGLLALAHEGPEGAVEGVGGDALRLELVEHAEVRVDARAERVSAQHARAEAVDRRDPGRLGGAGVGAPAEIEKAPAHARPHLGRGLLGEGDGEDGVDRPRRPRSPPGRSAPPARWSCRCRPRHAPSASSPGARRPGPAPGSGGRRSRLAPADRGIGAAAVPGARVGVGGELAGAHASVGGSDLPERPGELLAKLVGRQEVVLGEARAELCSASLATMPRGPLALPSGMYTPPAARSPSRRSTTSM